MTFTVGHVIALICKFPRMTDEAQFCLIWLFIYAIVKRQTMSFVGCYAVIVGAIICTFCAEDTLHVGLFLVSVGVSSKAFVVGSVFSVCAVGGELAIISELAKVVISFFYCFHHIVVGISAADKEFLG